MVAGVLFAVAALLQDRLGGATLSSSGYAGVIPLLGSLLLLGGLVGLHASQASVYGRLGTAGFRVAFAGVSLEVLLGAAVIISGSVVGQGASAAVALLGGVAAALAHLISGLGLLLLGIATLRAGALPMPWRLLPLAIFAVDILSRPLVMLFLGSELRRQLILREGPYAELLPFLVLGVPEVLVGVCWALLGYALWSGAGAGVRRAAPTG